MRAAQLLYLTFGLLVFQNCACQIYREVPSEKPALRQTKAAVAEIFVFVDSVLANNIGNDDAVYKYISATWNSVNRRFRQIQNPPITIKLVGIEISRSFEQEAFLLFKKDDETLSDWTRWRFSQWVLYHRKELPPHDIAYLQTGRILDSRLGHTYDNDACYDRTDSQRSSAVGTDWGQFDGIKLAAHLIGHTLGCKDFDKQGSSCPKYTQNVMNDAKETNMCTFSSCSISTIEHYINTWGMSKCFGENVGSADRMQNIDYNIMPGDIWSLNKQCQKLTGSEMSTFIKEKTNCHEITCRGANGIDMHWLIDPLPGTTELCQSDQKCLDCVCQ